MTSSATRTPRIHRTIDTERGPVEVSVNRRGCTGEWTPELDAALAEVVKVVVATYTKPKAPDA